MNLASWQREQSPERRSERRLQATGRARDHDRSGDPTDDADVTGPSSSRSSTGTMAAGRYLPMLGFLRPSDPRLSASTVSVRLGGVLRRREGSGRRRDPRPECVGCAPLLTAAVVVPRAAVSRPARRAALRYVLRTIFDFLDAPATASARNVVALDGEERECCSGMRLSGHSQVARRRSSEVPVARPRTVVIPMLHPLSPPKHVRTIEAPGRDQGRPAVG